MVTITGMNAAPPGYRQHRLKCHDHHATIFGGVISGYLKRIRALPVIWLCCLPAQADDITVERLGVEIMATLPHAADAFTQGLLLHDGYLYESTGLYGQSSLRKINPATGEVLQRLALDPGYFGEGLTRVGNQLIQLTWKEGLALVYDVSSLSLVQAHQYGGEGWGLCFDGEALWMSDGSATLYRRDPLDFSLLGQVEVTQRELPRHRLNDLACVGDHVYANIWKEHRIVRIDKRSGIVDAEIDTTPLLDLSGRPADPEAVLNGITHDPKGDEFYLTGKFWSRMFRVRFVPAAR
ncbi:glutaminyl-peptide cyclotransferase [Oceanisphaera psychrotolerans]|uniref:glutaminyl-peptide cyclotransferase n=1 Tax=Oceanisphaera psychrotolerans TaxID=1414654 RepID=UPI000A93A6D7|nr:glutaminyl-peptide cyclotransferase [Oceanisphaera psychrotolerans]